MATSATYLAPWANFYSMIGSSAAALTGLMFVVITLVRRSEVREPEGTATFSTPTVIHFSAALFLAAAFDAPWHLLIHPAILAALLGLFGIVYNLDIMRRTRRLTLYTPDAEDWAWYSIIPLVVYAAILVAAIALPRLPTDALFVLAGCTVLLIFIGIRNSWDVVTYIATGGLSQS